MTARTQLAALFFAYLCAVARVQAQPAEWWLRSPADQVMAAAEDIQKYPPEIAQYIRYLDLAQLTPKQRGELYVVYCGHLQHLSTRTSITNAKPVLGNGGSLLRINALDYGKSFAGAWENLKEFDPYFHQRFKTTADVQTKKSYYWPGGKGDDGEEYPAGTYYRTVTIKKNTVTNLPAPWLSPTPSHKAALTKLYALSKSEIPIVHADWFLWQTAIQEDRGPAGYYDFLGVKDQASYEKIIGFSQKVFDGIGKVELRAAVGISGVTLQPRAIARFGAVDSPYWKTFDFRLATGDKNPLQVLGKDIEKDFDASETFGVLPNGFWITGLFNKKGEVVNSAPPDIAGNHLARGNDKRVHVNLSCIECHSNAGLQDFSDWIKHMVTPPPANQLIGLDYEDLLLKRDQYLRQLKPFLSKDRITYTEAVREATGMKPPEYAKAYADAWYSYDQAQVNLAWVSRDLGIPEKELRTILGSMVSTWKGDLVLTALLKDDGTHLPIRQYHESLGRIMEAAVSYARKK